MSEFAGVIASAVTPRGRDGDIDYGAAFEVLDHLSRGGVQAVALFDAAGEYPCFGTEQRSRLVYLGVKRSRIPVLAGAGSATLDDSLDLARQARDAGAEAVLLPPPFFPEYSQDDLREFFLQFAAQLGGGIDVYVRNNGGPNPLCRGTVLDLLRTGCFTGIADRDGLQSDTTAISCEDANFPGSRRAGIPADLLEGACAVPELAAALNRAAGTKRADDSAVESAWCEFAGWVRRFPRPALVKAALSVRGLKTGARAVPLTQEKQRDLDRFAEWFRAWLPGVKRLCANE